MNKLYFQNNGHFDIPAMVTFGINIKPNPNAIGFFGTGFKYAVAIVLRLGGTISIETRDEHGKSERIKFEISETQIRDTAVPMVYYTYEREGETLRFQSAGFTTHLGANWAPWQAYRELYCNAVDEGGGVSDQREEFNTTIVVECPELFEAWTNKGDYFIHDAEPLFADSSVQVFEGAKPFIYCKGIAVAKCEPGHAYYNLMGSHKLTEDRTLENEYVARYCIARTLQASTNRELLIGVLSSGNRFERELAFKEDEVTSEEFLSVARSLTRQQKITNDSAKALAKRKVKRLEIIPADIAAEMGAEAQDRAAGLAGSIANYVDGIIHQFLPAILEAHNGWLPMDAAPKDGTPILALCQHDSDIYTENSDPGKSIYEAHVEGFSHAEDGPNVIEWGGEVDETDEDGGSHVTIPEWWFVRGSEFETAANPIGWRPIPAGTQIASIVAEESDDGIPF
jgi:hypothetical protein